MLLAVVVVAAVAMLVLGFEMFLVLWTLARSLDDSGVTALTLKPKRRPLTHLGGRPPDPPGAPPAPADHPRQGIHLLGNSRASSPRDCNSH